MISHNAHLSPGTTMPDVCPTPSSKTTAMLDNEERKRKKRLFVFLDKSEGEKCRARTMMHSKTIQLSKMTADHVPLRHIVAEIKLEKE